MIKVDVRGMSCPQPVLITKNAVNSNPKEIEIIADDNTAVNNISRFLKISGYKYEVNEIKEDYIINAKK
ncbi:sulfurtransferase TusA family protein [Tepidibacter hydrothermalis]|uniref:Sulfurtransferase TusA family protein n=1 Tax=Tepidibacter hydrothermalis TaxID=3036126 RepID=A0ABY8EA78_9FIRM|nr:sulfurtransferase TusA family protein [Tepidibacter hydrothermalis]WFD09706.1 sulfurtransferase TusA family protein [Tepidibacter hydrothermalis]